MTVSFEITAEAIVNTLGFILATASFIYGNRSSSRILQREIYMRVEIESIALFRHEIDIIENNMLLDDSIADTKKNRLVTESYTTQVLNLFEIIISCYREGVIDKDVFLTWFAWMSDVSTATRFVEFWQELKNHYKDDLVHVMEVGIALGRENLSDIERREAFRVRVGEYFELFGPMNWIRRKRMR